VDDEQSLEALAQADEALDTAREQGAIGPVTWFVRQVALLLRVIGRNAKRIAVTIAGATLVLVGVVLLVLPGPGLLVIIAGLAILATEFVWAERLLRKAKDTAAGAAEKGTGALRRLRSSSPPQPPPPDS